MKLVKCLKKDKYGITLISLVLTIVVLLILAAVTISALSGDNGILKQAVKAKEETEIANEKEQIQLIYTEATMLGGNVLEKTKELLDKTQKYETSILGKNIVIVNKKNQVFELNNDVEYIGLKQIMSDAQPIMKARDDYRDTDFWVQDIRTNIVEIETKNYIVIPKDYEQIWDVSKNEDSSVMAWIVNIGDISNPKYKLTIAANENIILSSGWCLFSNFTEVTKINLLSFDTSQTISLQSFFYNCEKLEHINISSFDTSQVTNMDGLFGECKLLKEINVSNFVTSNVTRMKAMFRNCKSIKVLDLSSFNMDKVSTTEGMFAWCDNLQTIYSKENWNTKVNITKYSVMFAGDWNLKGIKAYVDENIQDISMANYENGYFTYKN